MATIIDTLLIQLGFETKDIKRGQKETDEAIKRVRKGAKDTGDDLTKMGKDGAQAIHSLAREAVAFFAVLTAGKSLKAFVEDNTNGNVALQNMARNLGTTAKSLAAWQNVARSFGGTAEDVSGSMQSLVSQFQTVGGRQNLGVVFGYLGVKLQDANGKLRTMAQLIPDLATAAKRLGPQQFSALAGQAGFSQGFINMLEQSPDQLKAMYQAFQQYAPSAQDTASSEQLLSDWVKLTAQSEAFGRTILTELTPYIHDAITEMSNWIDKNHVWLQQDIVSDVKALGDYLKSIDWVAVEKGIKAFGSDANTVADAVGGWKTATELLFALWVGSKFLAVVSSITAISTAAGLASSSIGALLASAGIVASPLLLSGDTTSNPNALAAGAAQNSAEGSAYWSAYVAKNPQSAPTGSAAGVLMQGMSYFIKNGWSKAQAAGIMANAMRESSLDPGADSIDKKTGMHHRGLFQWDATRWAALTSIYGPNPTAAQQFAFAQSELAAGHGGAALKSATDQYTAAGIFNKLFEASGDTWAGIQQRMADTNVAMNAAQSAGRGDTSNHTSINAPITIHAPGGNPQQIKGALDGYFNTLAIKGRQANSGMQ